MEKIKRKKNCALKEWRSYVALLSFWQCFALIFNQNKYIHIWVKKNNDNFAFSGEYNVHNFPNAHGSFETKQNQKK